MLVIEESAMHARRRLREQELAGLPSGVDGLKYDRRSLVPGIVHIGIGAFHRAHMANYIDQLLPNHPDWAIIGASLRRPDTKELLEPQQYLYALTVQGDQGAQTKIIGSIVDIIDASQSSRSLIDHMARPSTRIVSLTVTEKGYCHEPATGRLQISNPAVMYDLANPQAPRSVPGILTAAFAERRARGHAGLSVLSCDNLQGNGRITRNVVLDFAQLHDPTLVQWIETHVSFPGTMVDRIVPSTTAEDRAAALATLGVEDAWPVVTEPFSQWVIEDNFVAGRPPFEDVGAELVDDVEPFELMKLRMLNGSHSTIAYLGLLLGKSFVAEVVGEPIVQTLLRRLIQDEAAPTIPLPQATLIAYSDRLLNRFGNSSLKHRCAQIAMDGSQKLPQRILAPMLERLEGGQSIDLLALPIAAWIAYVEKQASNEEPALMDPMAERLIGAVRSTEGNSADLVRAILAIREIVGDDRLKADDVVAEVATHLDHIKRDGPLFAIEQALSK
jgi:fructuronate reductase